MAVSRCKTRKRRRQTSNLSNVTYLKQTCDCSSRPICNWKANPLLNTSCERPARNLCKNTKNSWDQEREKKRQQTCALAYFCFQSLSSNWESCENKYEIKTFMLMMNLTICRKSKWLTTIKWKSKFSESFANTKKNCTSDSIEFLRISRKIP